jgi:hypothetical protein
LPVPRFVIGGFKSLLPSPGYLFCLRRRPLKVRTRPAAGFSRGRSRPSKSPGGADSPTNRRQHSATPLPANFMAKIRRQCYGKFHCGAISTEPKEFERPESPAGSDSTTKRSGGGSTPPSPKGEGNHLLSPDASGSGDRKERPGLEIGELSPRPPRHQGWR